MITPERALEALEISALNHPCPPETVPLSAACNRVLATPVLARHNQPPFRASAMDGYACIASDLSRLPVKLKIVGLSSAGHPFSGKLHPGQALRVFTGSCLPQETNYVVIQENCLSHNGDVTVLKTNTEGPFIRDEGHDFTKNQKLIACGMRLNARDLGLAASAGFEKLDVYQKPRVALMASGDELIPPGQKLEAGQIFSSNDLVLASLITSWGGQLASQTRAKDQLGDVLDTINRAVAEKIDILVTIGGASVGDFDLIHKALKKAGAQPIFDKVAMRPGKPLVYATLQHTHILCLPGNPVSAYVTAVLFLKPLLFGLQGHKIRQRHINARLKETLPPNGPRENYLRGWLTNENDGTHSIKPLPSDSAQFHLLCKANALIIRKPHANEAQTGDICHVIALDD